MKLSNSIVPALDQDFVPAVVWNREYRLRVSRSKDAEPFVLVLYRDNDVIAVHRDMHLPDRTDTRVLNSKYIERLFKFLLWQKGGNKVLVQGSRTAYEILSRAYAAGGTRAFDYNFMGLKVFGSEFRVEAGPLTEVKEPAGAEMKLGRHFEGCRVGFDLGGSDRKCAAVIDGRVIYADEVRWDPYFQSDPEYHIQGIRDSIRRAASKLPRVDAIGGSAAGIYVDNEVRVASIFRGVPPDAFAGRVRGLFRAMAAEEWPGTPFVVVNDGEVSALAGAESLKENAVLGISMGTSLAAGYVTPTGSITPWFNELAFVPVDYSDTAPADEWSGDIGCGVQYFSQQSVGRLLVKAGIVLPPGMALAEKLVEVQKLAANGDARALAIYDTVGVYLGYTLAHFADFYDLRNVLLLGRVLTGDGGERIIKTAQHVLNREFPDLAGKMRVRVPDESEKRTGQAVAAAGLPELKK